MLRSTHKCSGSAPTPSCHTEAHFSLIREVRLFRGGRQPKPAKFELGGGRCKPCHGSCRGGRCKPDLWHDYDQCLPLLAVPCIMSASYHEVFTQHSLQADGPVHAPTRQPCLAQHPYETLHP